MIDQAGIKTQAVRRYREYLSLLASGGNGSGFFPVELRFGKVKSGEASGRWGELRDELRILREGSDEDGKRSYHVYWEERRDRLAGTQRFPSRLSFPDAASLLAYLGKTQEAALFAADVGILVDAFPALRPWASARPLRIVEHAGDWGRLIAVISWLTTHPRPAVFLREVPAVEDTKFIERKKDILRELLDLVLGDEAIDRSASRFEERYGLRKVEPLVRIALLDTEIAGKRLSGLTDISVPASDLNRILFPEIETAIIFENKTNFSNADAFLTLPRLRGCAAIFGSGFAVGALRATPALSGRSILYWGDIDTQGLRILALLRASFPSCRSVLMDEETFDRFPEFRTDAPGECADEPQALDAAELKLYRRLVALEKGNRLEQERIPLGWAQERLTRMLE